MEIIKLTGISVYPIKSAKGISLETTALENIGIPFDRSFAVIGFDDKIITARENPSLLNIQTKIEKGSLELSATGKKTIRLVLNEIPSVNSISVGIFKDFTKAIPIEHNINNWISSVLNQPARLVKTDPNALRKMKDKYNAQEQDLIPFCDVAPLHLISENSLSHLNSQLNQPVTIARFRPNLVVKGCEPFAEETWKTVKIGSCLFDVAVKTVRCSFITIHPETTKRHPDQEPLRTLAKLNKLGNEVNFGIYLIPRKLGVIKKGDEVVIS